MGSGLADIRYLEALVVQGICVAGEKDQNGLIIKKPHPRDKWNIEDVG